MIIFSREIDHSTQYTELNIITRYILYICSTNTNTTVAKMVTSQTLGFTGIKRSLSGIVGLIITSLAMCSSNPVNCS